MVPKGSWQCGFTSKLGEWRYHCALFSQISQNEKGRLEAALGYIEQKEEAADGCVGEKGKALLSVRKRKCESNCTVIFPE